MSRSGYSDDYAGDCDYPNALELYRQAVHRAVTGYRGQAFLKRLRDALDAMPTKRLIVDSIRDERGDVCALGAVDPDVAEYDARRLAGHFRIATSLAAEIVFENDEAHRWKRRETPGQRWTRMRAWVDTQIVSPPAADAVDPHVGGTTE